MNIIKCPYCKHEHSPWNKYLDIDIYISLRCESCKQLFTAKAKIKDVLIFTKKIGGD